MSRYDLTPDDLFVLRDASPLARWNNHRMPLAYMRGPRAHGNDVMRVKMEDRPPGWNMYDVTEHRHLRAPGEVALVPECTAYDDVPDWAIAEAVRAMNPNIRLSAYGLVQQARRIAAERRGSKQESK